MIPLPVENAPGVTQGPQGEAVYVIASSDPEPLLESLRESHPGALAVCMVDKGGPAAAVRLARMGAYSCFDENSSAEELAGIIDCAWDEISSRRSAQARLEAQPWRHLLVGESSAMTELLRMIELVASRRCTVLITGESGTGKELVARSIHMAGARAHEPIIAINCGAIPEPLLEAELFGHVKGAFTGADSSRTGRFEQAGGGTVFLDEIGDLSPDLQVKLLRVLQEREVVRLGSSQPVRVDVRVIAASNVDLRQRLARGLFREDLYYRLNVVPLRIPPLRDRMSDVLPLARHFVAKVCGQEGIPSKLVFNESLQHLMHYDWPGNVRQLENVVEKAVALAGDRPWLLPSDLALPAVRPAAPAREFPLPDNGLDFAQTIMQLERNLLQQALAKTKGNKTLAAGLLQMKRTTLISKLRGLEEDL